MAVKPPPGAMEIDNAVPGLTVFTFTRMALLVVVEVLTVWPREVASLSNHDPTTPASNFLELLISGGIDSNKLNEYGFDYGISGFGFLSSFDIRISSFEKERPTTPSS